jgi:hypothetical protein
MGRKQSVLPRTPISAIKRTVIARRALTLLLLGFVPGFPGPGASGADNLSPTRRFDDPLPPLHPTVLTCLYKDHTCHVIGVSGSYGIVDDHGAPVRLISHASYEAARAVAFLPGSIEIREETALSTDVLRAVNGDPNRVVDRRPGNSNYEATVVASRAYSDCYR